MIAAFYKAVLT